MTVVKERLIYTAGTLKIDDTLARCRRLVIRSSVLRLPFSALYRNERSNPPKYFLGYCSVFINNYVSRVFPLEFENQIVFFWDNLASQIYSRMLCEFSNQTSNLVAHRVSIPLAGTLVPLPGNPGTFPGCPYDFIKFKLESGCRILVTATGEELETCEEAEFTTTVPDLEEPPGRFPGDQARDEDPARSEPEEGELPGDTAPATIDDPDSGLSSGVTLRVSYHRDATSSAPALSDIDVDYTVPDVTYTAEMRNGTAPGFCPTVQPQETWATSPFGADIQLVVHNTCNALSIYAQTYV